jgi:hypothetical protein
LLGGRPKGRKNDKTLQLEAEHAAFQQLILNNIQPLVEAQLLLAKGVAHVFRVSIGPRGGRGEPELVTNPDELHEAIQAIQTGAGYGDVAEDGRSSIGFPMVRQLLVVVVLLCALTEANGKEVEARNEDVPKGPAIAAPAQSNSKPSQSPTGSVNGGGKSAPSGGDGKRPAGGSGKGGAPGK